MNHYYKSTIMLWAIKKTTAAMNIYKVHESCDY